MNLNSLLNDNAKTTKIIFKSVAEQLRLTSEFNEVTTEGSDLGGANCKFAEPLNSCSILR